MRKRTIWMAGMALAMLGAPGHTHAQDMNYSQYFSTPVYYNPAYTGINTGLRARFLFRDQWPSLPSPFKSYYFSADLGDRNLPGSGGIGLVVNQDTPGSGLIKNFGAALTVGVRIPVTSYMATQIGIKAGIMQRTLNWGDLVFSNQLSGKYGNVFDRTFIPPDANQRVVPDFGIGGLVQFISPQGNFSGSAGLGIDHLFQPDVSFMSTGPSLYPRKWVGQFDLVVAAGPGGSSSSSSAYRGGDDPLKINIGGIYQNQANMGSLQIGLNLLKYNIYVGSWYKTTMTGVVNNAAVLVAGYRYSFAEDMSIKFMYSYDLQISGALQGAGGAHEISLVLEFDKVSIFGGSGGFMSNGSGHKGGGEMECATFY